MRIHIILKRDGTSNLRIGYAKSEKMLNVCRLSGPSSSGDCLSSACADRKRGLLNENKRLVETV